MYNKKTNLLLSLLLTIVSATTFSETFSKLTSKFNGLAWLTNFTGFTLIEDVFVIQNNKGESTNNKFGADGSIHVPTKEEYGTAFDQEDYNEFVENIKKYDSSASFPETMPSTYKEFQDLINSTYIGNEDNVGDTNDGYINVTGENSYDGYYYMPQSKFESIINGQSATNFAQKNEYAIGNVGAKAYSVSNYSDQPMLISFSMYYYSLESNSSSRTISCGIYNVTNHLNETITKDSDELLKGEFVCKYTAKEGGIFGLVGGTEYTYYYFFMDDIPNVQSERTGGGKQVEDPNGSSFSGTKYYYPYYVNINPYSIKLDPNLKEYYENLAASNGQTNVRFNGFDSTTIDTRFLLSDFIVPANKKNYIFNVNLYCGSTYGAINTSNVRYAFLAGIEMNASPIYKGDSIDNWILNNEPTYYNSMWNE